MTKYENPIRGYLSCPVCQSVATTHQVGEGQLIATGEPPKNSRNIGLMYYRCPECGNSPHSRKITDYIHAHSVAELTELEPKVTEDSSVIEPVLITEPNRVEAIELTDAVTETLAEAESVTEDVTEQVTEPKPKGFVTFKRVLVLLGLALFLVWMVGQLLPKSPTEEVTENAGA